MFARLNELLGTTLENWLIVTASGLAFLALINLLPRLYERWRGKDGPPLL